MSKPNEKKHGTWKGATQGENKRAQTWDAGVGEHYGVVVRLVSIQAAQPQRAQPPQLGHVGCDGDVARRDGEPAQVGEGGHPAGQLHFTGEREVQAAGWGVRGGERGDILGGGGVWSIQGWIRQGWGEEGSHPAGQLHLTREGEVQAAREKGRRGGGVERGRELVRGAGAVPQGGKGRGGSQGGGAIPVGQRRRASNGWAAAGEGRQNCGSIPPWFHDGACSVPSHGAALVAPAGGSTSGWAKPHEPQGAKAPRGSAGVRRKHARPPT